MVFLLPPALYVPSHMVVRWYEYQSLMPNPVAMFEVTALALSFAVPLVLLRETADSALLTIELMSRVRTLPALGPTVIFPMEEVLIWSCCQRRRWRTCVKREVTHGKHVGVLHYTCLASCYQ